MGKIKLLPDTLASQVAAGEVVERPASVVKELIENSIDAGAKNIEIRVRRGGISSIQITDDGYGMSRTDALMSLERHATSKLRTSDDLAHIMTMGFRGEALPSIASVSRFRLTTRETNALAGSEIVVNGGRLGEVRDAGEAPGTQIEVRSLFYNLPARRKFLRAESTEFSHVEHQVRVHAIAHPTIRFSLVHGDRTVFHLPATESLFERIRGLVGNEIALRLCEVEEQEVGGVRFHGFIGEPGLGRSNRQLQLTFLNRRPVEGSLLQIAIREGYHTALMKGQHPMTFLFLDMAPERFDVNVHPAKREVRFHDGIGLRQSVVDVISRSLAKRVRHVHRTPSRSRQFDQVDVSPSDFRDEPPRNALPDVQQEELIPMAQQRALRRDWMEVPEPVGLSGSQEIKDRIRQPDTSDIEVDLPASAEQSASVHGADPRPEASAKVPDQKLPQATDFKILGVLGRLYVLMESKDGLVLMDQHAAHERVLFEQMRKRIEEGGVPSQRLLVPVTLEMTPKEYDLVEQNLETLQKLGIGAEAFGNNTIKVDCLPTFVSEADSNKFINSVLGELERTTRRMSVVRLGEDMVATTVCRHAVKANDSLHREELEKLLEDLLKCDLPFCCPHGRPTLVQISYTELERKFGRMAP